MMRGGREPLRLADHDRMISPIACYFLLSQQDTRGLHPRVSGIAACPV